MCCGDSPETASAGCRFQLNHVPLPPASDDANSSTCAGRQQRSDPAFPNITTADTLLGLRSRAARSSFGVARCDSHRFLTCRSGFSSGRCSHASACLRRSGRSANPSRKSTSDVPGQLVAMHYANLLAGSAALRHLVLLDGMSRFPRRRSARPRSSVARTPHRACPCPDSVPWDHPASSPPRWAREPCFEAHRVHEPRLPCGAPATSLSTCIPSYLPAALIPQLAARGSGTHLLPVLRDACSSQCLQAWVRPAMESCCLRL